jgi:hypothetical protein
MSTCPSVHPSIFLSVRLSVSSSFRPPVYISAFLAWRFSAKFVTGCLYVNLLRNWKYCLKCSKKSGILHEYCCSRHTKFTATALLCNTRYFYIVDSDCTSAVHTKRIVALHLRQRSRERAPILRVRMPLSTRHASYKCVRDNEQMTLKLIHSALWEISC